MASAGAIRGYELCGYLFFGSASSLVESLKGVLTSDTPPEFLILDFDRVTGFDISVVANFQRVVLAARSGRSRVVVTAAAERFAEAVRRNFPADALESVRFFDTLDQGLEWCEDAVILRAETAMAGESTLRGDLFDRSVDEVMRHLERQEYVESLVARLKPWVTHREHQPGEVIAGKGVPMEGLCLVTWGSAVESHPESGRRMRCLEPGSVIAAPAAFDPLHAPPVTVTADAGCRTAALSRGMRLRLEAEEPALAAELYGYLILCDAGAGDR
jgi:SulP family sulfate permease